MAIDVVTFRILVKPENVLERDEAYKAAKRLGLDLSLESKVNREQAAVDQGEVVGFGPLAFRDYGGENPLKIGDTIVYARHAGKKVVDPADKETEFVVINDEDVVAILRS